MAPTCPMELVSDNDVRAITTGVRKDESKLLPLMGYHHYSNINDADLINLLRLKPF